MVPAPPVRVVAGKGLRFSVQLLCCYIPRWIYPSNLLFPCPVPPWPPLPCPQHWGHTRTHHNSSSSKKVLQGITADVHHLFYTVTTTVWSTSCSQPIQHPLPHYIPGHHRRHQCHSLARLTWTPATGRHLRAIHRGLFFSFFKSGACLSQGSLCWR